MPAAITQGIKSTASDLLKHIGESWQPNSEGNLQSSEWQIHAYEAAFVQILNFSGSALTPSEFTRCAYDALRKICRDQQVTVEHFESTFSEICSKVTKKRKSKYRALTRCYFSAHSDVEIPIKLWGTEVLLTNAPDARFDLEEFFLSGYGRVRPAEPTFGMYMVSGPVMARSPSAALDIINEDNRLLLGLLAFWMNIGRFSMFVGRERPQTKFIPGKEIILFDKDFRRNEDRLSYYHTVPADCVSVYGKDYDRLVAITKVASDLSKSEKSKRDYICYFLKLYYDAVSEQSSQDQIVKLWKAAEFATFSQGSSTEQIAKRLALISADFDEAYAICSAVGHRRHQIVHNEKTGIHMSDIIDLFRNIVEEFFRFSLSHKVPSLKAWKAAVEVGSSRYSSETLDAALPVLDLLKSN